MNELLKQLVEQATNPDYDSDDGAMNELNVEKFAQAIVMKIMERLESEIALAYEQDQDYTAATLQALSLEILDDFDMELPVDDDWDAEAELQKIFDEFPNAGKDDDQHNNG